MPLFTGFFAVLLGLTVFFHYQNSTELTAEADDAIHEFYELIIKDHKFSPDSLELPAQQRVKVIIKNLDPNLEEFESHDLNIEKMIPPSNQIVIFVGPLEPGTYKFFGEMHEDTAQGQFVVK